MIEILFLIFLSNKNASNAKERGRKPGVFIALTIILWFVFEISGAAIGNAMELGYGAYLIAFPMAALGGLLSYIIAKNCKEGDYVDPAQSTVQEVMENPEPMSLPTSINVIRDSSFVGVAVKWNIFLNGTQIRKKKNGESINAVTNQRNNVLMACNAQGGHFDPLAFEVIDGSVAEIHFKSGNFLPKECKGIVVKDLKK